MAYLGKPRNPVVRAIFVILVRWPGKPVPEALGWCNLVGGVVAYRHPDFWGSPEAAYGELLAHLGSGTDFTNPSVGSTSSWEPMPCAPLSLEPIELELFTPNQHIAAAVAGREPGRAHAMGDVKVAWYGFLDTLEFDLWTRLDDLPDCCASCENYNLFFHEDPGLMRWRRQAFNDSSLLLRLAARPLRAAWRRFSARHRSAREILAIVDGGRRLNSAISGQLAVPGVVWRRCRALTLDFVSIQDIAPLLWQFGAHLPPERHPDRVDEKFLRILWHWLGYLNLPQRELLVPLASRCGKRICEELKVFAAEVGQYSGDVAAELAEGLAPPVFDVARDFIDELCLCMRNAVPPAASPEARVQNLVSDWLRCKGVGSFMRTACIWHDLVIAQRESVILAELAGPDRWRPLLDSPLHLYDRTVVELSEKEALRDEGRAMHHCVAIYATHCAAGTRVFSIRDSAGKRLSTLALAGCESGSDLRFAIDQLRGHDNANAGPGCLKVAKELARRVNSAEFTLRRTEILDECRAHVDDDMAYEGICVKAALIEAGSRKAPVFRPLWDVLFSGDSAPLA